MKAFLATLKGKIIAGALGVLVVAGGIVAAVALSGPEDYRSIKVDEVSGQAIIVDEKNNEAEAYKGMNLKAGNAIEVKDGANMTLLMDSDKYMFADEGTKFKVEASGDSAKANTKTRIILEEGSVLCRLDSKLSDDETFEVETPNSVMSVRGTIFKMTIYKDENGENYAKVDVLEGAVKVDLYKENGEKMEEEGLIEAGQAATVHSNTDISEFVIGASDISYDDFSGPMAEFVINTVDNGREICIGENQFKHYTGYETHPEEEIIVKEPTATEEGLKEIYCPTCDEVIRTEIIPTTGEAVEEEDEEDEPAEDTPEVETEEEITETEPDVTEEETTTTESTVTQTHTHSYGSWSVVTAASCETAGSQSRTCSGCGNKETQVIPATGHSYSSWTVTTAASCETAGVETRTCSNSGCGKTETQAIAALGHSYSSWTVTTTASCETAGSQSRTCTTDGCGKTETQTIPATGHKYSSWVVTTAAKCMTAGVETRTCTNSGCQSTETQAIAATGHSTTYVHRVTSSSYENNTFTANYNGVCSTCGETVSSEEHSGTYTSYQSETHLNAKCSCGYEFSYSF